MKKSKTTRSSTSGLHAQYDVSHLVLILVIGLFFGFLGFQLGKTATSPRLTLSTTDAASALNDSGSLMKQTGALMKTKGTQYRDQELTLQGETLETRGQLMLDKGTDLLGKLGQ